MRKTHNYNSGAGTASEGIKRKLNNDKGRDLQGKG